MDFPALDLKFFRNLLEDKRQEIVEALNQSTETAKPVALDPSSVGRLSRMDAMQQQSMALETRRRLEIDLQRVQSALHRLGSGDYGVCLRCEEAIPLKRLELDPAALTCVKCASKLDLK